MERTAKFGLFRANLKNPFLWKRGDTIDHLRKFCDLNSEKERLEDTIKNGLYHRTASLYIDLNYGTYKIFYIKYLLLDLRKADKRKSGS